MKQTIPWPRFKESVQALSWSSRLAFGAICLERIAFVSFPYVSPMAANLLRDVVNAAWSKLSGKDPDEIELVTLHGKLEEYHDKSKGPEWIEGTTPCEP